MPDLVIIPSAEFCRQTKRLAKKYRSLAADLTAFQEMITKNPFVGTDLGGGKRKIRLAVTSKAKGKSGGMRIITFNIEQKDNHLNVYLVTIYTHNQQDNISVNKLNSMKKVVKEL